MTRQNITDGVREILTVKCPTCAGDGVVLSAETVALEGLRKMREIASDHPDEEAFLVRVHPKVAALLNHPDSGLLELEAENGKQFHFEGGEALPIDNFDLIETGERVKIEERALPFQPDEEVFVKIEEPHMYNADDAIARIDSYIISVTGAADAVGSRKLVKIESVERASAVASLLPDAEQPEDTTPKRPQEKANRSRRSRNSGSQKNGRSGGGSRSPKPAEKTADSAKPEPDGAVAVEEAAPAAETAPEPAEQPINAPDAGAEKPEDEKSVTSGRFGLRRGRRKRGKK